MPATDTRGRTMGIELHTRYSLATPRRGPYGITLLGTAAYAVFDEWRQSFVPGRSPSVSDVVLDIVGSLGMRFFLRPRAWRETRS